MSDNAVFAKNNTRNYGLDLLRCVAMIMIVILHYLDKGKVLTPLSSGEPFKAADVVAWFMEALAIVAVNLYMLMSGYLLYKSSFKLSRLINLVIKVWLYSVIVGVLGIILGGPVEPVDTYFFLRLLLPISMNTYWFMTAYVFFYLLTPVLGIAARAMSKGQLKFLLAGLMVFHVVIKSIAPATLSGDAGGMDAMWYIILYFVAVYIRRFTAWGDEGAFVSGKRPAAWISFVLYVVGAFLVMGEALVLRGIYVKTGSLSYILGISYDYNHILVLVTSIALFTGFLAIRIPVKVGQYFGIVGKYSLGVYLLHENLSIRYAWEKLLGCEKATGVADVILFTLIAAIVVFIIGVIVDFCGSFAAFCILSALKKTQVGKSFTGLMKKADSVFSSTEGSTKNEA
jgi:surface polysaccharide O-acyltransferase-like enzyme